MESNSTPIVPSHFLWRIKSEAPMYNLPPVIHSAPWTWQSGWIIQRQNKESPALYHGGCHRSDPVSVFPLIQGRQRQNELVPGAKGAHQSMPNPHHTSPPTPSTINFQELALPGIILFFLIGMVEGQQVIDHSGWSHYLARGLSFLRFSVFSKGFVIDVSANWKLMQNARLESGVLGSLSLVLFFQMAL